MSVEKELHDLGKEFQKYRDEKHDVLNSNTAITLQVQNKVDLFVDKSEKKLDHLIVSLKVLSKNIKRREIIAYILISISISLMIFVIMFVGYDYYKKYDDCVEKELIRANRNSNTYFTPDSQYYQYYLKEEKCFTSEYQAMKAGYVKSKQ